MHGRRLRHIAGVLAVTVASGLLFSVSALNERKNPAATSDLSIIRSLFHLDVNVFL